MSRVIVTTHYNRPKHTRALIDNLKACKGIEDYTVVFSTEPGCDEVIQAIEEAEGFNKQVYVNDRLMGLWPHKKEAVARAFQYGDFVIHIEDDLLVGRDILQYFNWCSDAFKDDDDVFTVLSYNHGVTKEWFEELMQKHPNALHMVYSERATYSPLAWATWADRWATMGDWTGQDADLQLRIQGNRYGVRPMLSRVSHYGLGSGATSHEDLNEVLARNKQGGVVGKGGIIEDKFGSEWVKLDENNIKSRAPEDELGKFTLDYWAGNYPGGIPDGEFWELRIP